MIYKAIGLMSGSSLDGLDIVYVHFHETGGKWTYEIIASGCYAYPEEWRNRLQQATTLTALDYQLLHTEYGHYLGAQVNAFINEHALHHKVHLVASHGHTSFHMPARRMTAQLGDGAAIAASTGLPVVSDLRSLDIAFGGQGAPIVPIGEKLLFPGYDLLLNLGGIANISCKTAGEYIAFDICPANRVLNMLANKAGMLYDTDGNMAADGKLADELLNSLNQQPYYEEAYPKSLANDFGIATLFPLIEESGIPLEDMLRTYVEHVAHQVKKAITRLPVNESPQLLVTGGGALNLFLINRLRTELEPLGITLTVPEKELVSYKEALIMALIGVLRWREEYNVIAAATGASRNSVGGALWLGGEA